MIQRFRFALLVVFAALVCLTPVHTAWDDGLWPLSITVVSAPGSQIQSVSGEAFSSPEVAQQSVEHLAPPETFTYAAVADPFRGETLTLSVPTSVRTRSALVWSDSRYNQMRWLVVLAQYVDGRREGRLIEIPDLRQARSLRIEFP